MTCRCPSCGYIHDEIDALRPVLDPEPVVIPAEVIPVVVQQARCPLCGGLFDDAAEYDAHRARNCAPAPPAPAGDPVVTDPNPAVAAESQGD